MKIGFIGIGLMGGPLARNLIRAGREVLFFARNKEHIEKTLSAGTTGKLVSSVRDLADCDIVFTCLPLPQTVKAVMMEDDGLLNHMKPHSVYIDTSTIDPHTAGEIEAYAARKNIHYLGCTLGLGPAQAELAQEPIFAGGDRATFDRCKDIRQVQRYSGYHRFARPLSRRRKTGLRFQDYQQYGRHDQSGRLSRRNSSGAALRHRYKPVFGTARHDRRRLQSAAPPRPADY